MDGAIEGSGWLIVTVIAALGIIAWGSIIVVLFLRKAIIIGTVVFGPFAMAGLASGKTKSWAVKWVEVVVALALSKFVICAILTLGLQRGRRIGHRRHHRRLARIGLGVARGVLSARRVAVRALRRVTRSAPRTPPAWPGAWGNARQAGRLGAAGAGAAGGVVGGPPGWLAGRAGSGTNDRSTPPDPSTAVGAQGPAATAPGSGRRHRRRFAAQSAPTAVGGRTDRGQGAQPRPPRSRRRTVARRSVRAPTADPPLHDQRRRSPEAPDARSSRQWTPTSPTPRSLGPRW